MSLALYADAAMESQEDARRREHDALDAVVHRLESAQRSGADRDATIDALDAHDLLWSAFIQDLASDENGLPQELRAGLLSIGLSVRRQSLALREAGGGDLAALIAINAAIRDGLR